MEKIVSLEELKHAIQVLESERAENGKQLKEHFYLVYNKMLSLKAISGTILGKVAELGFAIAGGYVSKQIVGGIPGGMVRKLLGSLMQVGVTRAIVKRQKTIESVGRVLIEQIFRRKSRRSNNYKTPEVIQTSHN